MRLIGSVVIDVDKLNIVYNVACAVEKRSIRMFCFVDIVYGFRIAQSSFKRIG